MIFYNIYEIFILYYYYIFIILLYEIIAMRQNLNSRKILKNCNLFIGVLSLLSIVEKFERRRVKNNERILHPTCT